MVVGRYAKAQIVNTALLVLTIVVFFRVLSLMRPSPGEMRIAERVFLPAAALGTGELAFCLAELLSSRWYRFREFWGACYGANPNRWP